MDLRTSYLGLRLRNPLVAGASPLTGNVDNLRRFEDEGAGAVVLPSLFEEQIERERQLIERLIITGIDTYPEALTYFPAQSARAMGTEHYVELVRRASRAIDIPVIASLNGVTDHGWITYARELEAAGASAIELNIYFIPSDLSLSGSDVERRYLDIVKAVREVVKIPLAVKIGPYFSAMGRMAKELVGAGANGLVLFNRFYQPDIDLTQLALLPNLELSTANEIRLPLLWIGVLSGQLHTSLAASTGVDGIDEVVKYLLAGADVVMVSSAFIRHGISHVKALLDGLTHWLSARNLETIDSIRGRMSHRGDTEPAGSERTNYIRILQGYQRNLWSSASS